MAAPANDNFADAQLLTGTSGSVSGSNVEATWQTGEPGSSINKTVWFKWVADTTGTLTVNSAGSTYDTVLIAYSGSALGSLVQLAGNDDFGGTLTSQITFTVVTGRTYYLWLSGYANDAGNYTLSWSFSPAAQPAADYFLTLSGYLATESTLTVFNAGAAFESYVLPTPSNTAWKLHGVTQDNQFALLTRVSDASLRVYKVPLAALSAFEYTNLGTTFDQTTVEHTSSYSPDKEELWALLRTPDRLAIVDPATLSSTNSSIDATFAKLVAVSADGSRVALWHWDDGGTGANWLSVYDTATSAEVLHIATSYVVSSLALSPDGALLAATSTSLKVYVVATEAEYWSYTPSGGATNHRMSFSSDLAFAAAIGSNLSTPPPGYPAEVVSDVLVLENTGTTFTQVDAIKVGINGGGQAPWRATRAVFSLDNSELYIGADWENAFTLGARTPFIYGVASKSLVSAISLASYSVAAFALPYPLPPVPPVVPDFWTYLVDAREVD